MEESKNKTLDVKTLSCATKLLMPKELADDVIQQGMIATNKWQVAMSRGKRYTEGKSYQTRTRENFGKK